MDKNSLYIDKEHQLLFSEFFPNWKVDINRSEIDFVKLFKLICFKHRIVNHFLASINEDSYPQKFIVKLKEFRIQKKKEALRKLALQIEIQQLLKGYNFVFLKGIGLSQRLYNDFSFRMGSDIDFYVKKKDEKEIIAILNQHGYAKINNYEHHYVLKKEGISIEVHRKLSSVHKTNWLEKQIWSNVDYIDINKTLFPVMSIDLEFQNLMYNGSVHLWKPLMLLLDYLEYKSKFNLVHHQPPLQKLERSILNFIKMGKVESYNQKIILQAIIYPSNNHFSFLVKKAYYFSLISEHSMLFSLSKSCLRMISKTSFFQTNKK